MGVAALSVAGRETTLPPMQFILVLYSSHDYPKKGGTSLLKEIRRRGTAAPTEAELAGRRNAGTERHESRRRRPLRVEKRERQRAR